MMFQIRCLEDLERAMSALDHDDRLELLCIDLKSSNHGFKIIRLRVKDKTAFKLHEIRDGAE